MNSLKHQLNSLKYKLQDQEQDDMESPAIPDPGAAVLRKKFPHIGRKAMLKQMKKGDQ